MKKYITLLCGLLIFSISNAYEPSITEMVAGQDELNCKQVVFISGKPMVLEGTAEVAVSKKGKNETETYSSSLSDGGSNTLSNEYTFSITSTEKSND